MKAVNTQSTSPTKNATTATPQTNLATKSPKISLLSGAALPVTPPAVKSTSHPATNVTGLAADNSDNTPTAKRLPDLAKVAECSKANFIIRKPTFSNIPAMLELFREMHKRSRYAGIATLDEQLIKQSLARAMQLHCSPNDGGSWLMVVEQDGVIEGFLLGVLERLYHVARELTATDVFFYVSERAHPNAAGQLLDEFTKWADACGKVIELRFGVSDAIGDPERTGALYRRRGYRPAGLIFAKNKQT